MPFFKYCLLDNIYWMCFLILVKTKHLSVEPVQTVSVRAERVFLLLWEGKGLFSIIPIVA